MKKRKSNPSMGEMQDTLARNISAARSALKLSQDQLAASGGISRATLNQIEGGASSQSDPRLSTLVGLAAALGISPVFLLFGHDELEAIAKASEGKQTKAVKSKSTDEKVETIRRLLQSGIAKNRTKAIEMGVTSATTAGATAGAIAAAAIGTTLLPGIGAAIGVALAAWIAQKNIEEDK